jgi:hypothetical protein
MLPAANIREGGLLEELFIQLLDVHSIPRWCSCARRRDHIHLRRGSRFAVVLGVALPGGKWRKLDGDWIEPGDWHWMMDIARQLNDPQEPFLRMYQHPSPP